MEYCDLHNHSTFSDGTCSPKELVDLAIASGLKAIALTDHNSLGGIDDFIQVAKDRLEVCPGCEFTTSYDGQELHLLGLFLDKADISRLKGALDTQINRKIQSNKDTIERLAKAGYDVSYEEFIDYSGPGSKNRVHISRYLVSKGIISEVQEGFKTLLSKSAGYYVEGEKLEFLEMIKLINEAGGVSVWAHPLFNVDRDTCEKIMIDAKNQGLDGVEVLYSTYTDEDTEFMINLSEKYNILKSGGSDFHGDNKPDIKIGIGRGNLEIPYEYYEKLKERSNTKTMV